MTEQNPEQPSSQGGGQQPPPDNPQQQSETQDVNTLPQWARDAISKANGEAAKYRTQVRDLEPKANQFAQLEEASKTEAQRLQEAVEAAHRDRDTAQADALKFRIAAEHGIGKDDLDLLGVGDEETIAGRAKRIAEMRAAVAGAGAKPPARPAEQLRPGATPSTEQLSDDDRLYQTIYGQPK